MARPSKAARRGQFTAQQIKAISALASGKNRSKAAEFAGVYRQRVTEWMTLPLFAEAVAEEKRALAATLRHAMLKGYGEAVNLALQIAKDETANASDRIEAIRTAHAMMGPLGEVFAESLSAELSADSDGSISPAEAREWMAGADGQPDADDNYDPATEVDGARLDKE